MEDSLKGLGISNESFLDTSWLRRALRTRGSDGLSATNMGNQTCFDAARKGAAAWQTHSFQLGANARAKDLLFERQEVRETINRL